MTDALISVLGQQRVGVAASAAAPLDLTGGPPVLYDVRRGGARVDYVSLIHDDDDDDEVKAVSQFANTRETAIAIDEMEAGPVKFAKFEVIDD